MAENGDAGNDLADHPLYSRAVVKQKTAYEGTIGYTFVRDKQMIPAPKSFLEQFKSVESKEGDIWLVSYPKTGTTWLSKVILLLLCNGDEAAAEQMMQEVYDCKMIRVEVDMYSEDDVQKRIEDIAQLKMRPRVFFCHLPREDMPPAALAPPSKVIVPLRNPKDTCVSFYHFHRATVDFGYFQGTFSDFLKAFVAGQTVWGDFWAWYQGYWRRHAPDPNFLFVHYEDMLLDPRKKISEVASFLGVDPRPELIDLVVQKTSFKALKQKTEKEYSEWVDPNISPFFRKGQAKDWKNWLTVAENEAFNDLHETRMADTPDLVFRGME